MTKDEIEKEWQEELKKFLDYHGNKMKDMTEGESNKYVRENKLNEKIKEMQKYYQEKYKHYL